MENTIKLPKQLKFDNRGFHFINDAEKNKTALIVGHGQASNDAAFMSEVITRYNNYPALKAVTIVMSIIAGVSLTALLYF